MILKFSDNGKAIKQSKEIILPNFVVITGENGSGKTQLLEEIYQAETNEIYVKSRSLPSGTHPVFAKKPTALFNEENEAICKIYSANIGLSNLFTEKTDAINLHNKGWMDVKWISQAHQIATEWFEDADQQIRILNRDMESFFRQCSNSQNSEMLPHRMTRSIDASHLIKYQIIKEKLGIKKNGIIKEVDHLITLQTPNSLFSLNLELVFHQFHLMEKYYPHLVESNEKPLSLFNEILNKANFNYKAEYTPSENDFEIPPVQLVDKNNNATINIDSLSSGEKTIMSLALTLYNARSMGNLPQSILFDEPDAMLHPSMAKIFIDVVKDVLVDRHQIKVIITTHSPSTVILSGEESLFIMRRYNGYPEKITKEDAVKSLTSGLRIIVSPDKMRQIFVESEYDAIYYDRIFNLSSAPNSKDVELSFISSGTTKIDKNGDRIATCDQVLSITEILRSNGNKTVYGIVDWDKKDTIKDGILVMGKGNRYSIENYLLEPFLIGLALIREAKVTPETIGLSSKFRYVSSDRLNSNELQKITNYILNKIISELEYTPSLETKECQYINGNKIELPIWFLEFHGHELEKIIVRTFPELNSIRPKQGSNKQLKIGLLEILEDFPMLLSIDFTDLFIKLKEVM